jgi:hypothetical protein
MEPPPDISAQDRTWAQIDHQVVLLRTKRAAFEFGVKYSPRLNEYRRGNAWSDLVAMGKVYIEWAKEWTEKLFVIYTEVWEEQGKVRTPDFLRVILNKALVPEIEKRVRPAKSEIIQVTRRKREFSSGLTGLLNRLEVDAGTLRNEWRRRIETEAWELQLKQVQRPAQVEEVATVGKGDWLFDLAKWRREWPEELFEPFLHQCKTYLYEQLPKVPTAQLRRWLSYYEAERAALLRACPYLERRWQSEPSDPEEQDFRMGQMVLPLLRLEIDRRGQNATASDNTTGQHPLDSPPDIVKRRAIVRQNPKLSTLDLCCRFDFDGIPLPERWRTRFEVTNWKAACLHEQCKNLVHTLVSRDRKKAH